jgi:hypothetical protein
MSSFSGMTYQASDLSRNYRSVLNSARQEDTLIRDTDGATLILLSLDRALRDRTMAYSQTSLVFSVPSHALMKAEL